MKNPGTPNFVFILADDLGYSDLGCYGGRSNCSPMLDKMAAGGLRFTDGYANSSVCSPTRFALITGRYQYRLRGGADEPLAGRAVGDPTLGLPPAHPTLPSLLRDAGYATALIGKWHLGFPPHFGPLKSGYETFFGIHAGGVDYFSHNYRGNHDLYEGEEEVFKPGYFTDLISERAVDYIRQQAGGRQPFLLSVHYTAPHWPWETRADEAESKRIGPRIAHFDGGSVETYQTMIHHMDEGIGKIFAALEAIGAADNTLVVFTSDNGGERFSDVWPFIGKKMDLLEGGIRVPLIARWPARLKANTATRNLAITMDWVATFFAAAGVAAHPDYPLDGQNLLPVLDDPGTFISRELFWRMTFRNQRALRADQWKYISLGGDEFLFDLSRDARERANLAKREPARFEAMRARFERWNATMPAIPADAVATAINTSADLAAPSG
ncbi:MAG: sulfatase [Burkholderiales bacterium]